MWKLIFCCAYHVKTTSMESISSISSNLISCNPFNLVSLHFCVHRGSSGFLMNNIWFLMTDFCSWGACNVQMIFVYCTSIRSYMHILVFVLIWERTCMREQMFCTTLFCHWETHLRHSIILRFPSCWECTSGSCHQLTLLACNGSHLTKFVTWNFVSIQGW